MYVLYCILFIVVYCTVQSVLKMLHNTCLYYSLTRSLVQQTEVNWGKMGQENGIKRVSSKSRCPRKADGLKGVQKNGKSRMSSKSRRIKRMLSKSRRMNKVSSKSRRIKRVLL